MADYIYLLETRLSPAQLHAIGAIRTVAREAEHTVFLTGGAVRDLTGGASIRDLDLTLQGDPLKLKKQLEQAGATIAGENTPAHQLFLTFPGGVRVELAAAVDVTFPKPGKPKYELSNIINDLRRRDFTANGMGISLNEGSYGLLMDPLNGVADIENRELRLVSNYGFIEDPSRLIRAARLSSRLGWQMEERTRARYETAKEENYIGALNPFTIGYELEEIFHEDDPLRILRALEAEGWMTALYPALASAKANTTALQELAQKQGELQLGGILAHSGALAFPLLTGKMPPADVSRLKELFIRPGFVREIETVDAQAKDFATKLTGKDYAAPSAVWKLLHSAEPDLVLALYFGSKSGPVQARLKAFLNDSPGARQRIPHALMAEMRITPDLPAYADLVDKLFFELMDGKLATPEDLKAYLEPFSPPAPPPPVNLRRAKARKEARPSRAKGKKAAAEQPATVAEEEELIGIAEGIMEQGDLTGENNGPEPPAHKPIQSVAPEAADPAPKPAAKKSAPQKTAQAEAAKPEPPASTPVKATTAVKAPAKAVAAKATPAKAAPAKAAAVPAKATAPAKKIAAKATPAKSTTAKAPAKTAPAKAAAKKATPAKAAKKAPAKLAVKNAAPAKKAAVKAPLKAAKKVVVKKAAPSRAPAKKAAPARKAPAKAAKKAPAKAAKKSGRR